MELIVSLRPDVILADDSQKPGLSRVVELGYRVVFTPTTRLRSLDELYRLILDLGKMLGAEAKAEPLVAGMKADLARLTEKIGRGKNPRVLYVFWWEPLTVAPGEGLHQSILSIAGGENVAAAIKGLYARVSDDFVLRQDPDFILVQREEDIRTAKARPGWVRLAAVRNNRVITIPADRIARYGPRLVEGINELAQRLHPELELIPKHPPRPSPRRGEGQGEESQSPR